MQPRNEIPVYLFCGFLEAGKTKYIQSILEDPRFNTGDGILLLVCEEGEEEYDPSLFASANVSIETFDDADSLTPDRLEARRRRANASLVVVEYNGMWQIDDLYYALPESWMIYQQLTFIDATTILNYNANMRQLVFDKVKSSDGIVFNRVKADEDIMPYHKLVRDIDRNAQIIYEKDDGSIQYDEIVDPLPFDIDAPVVEIADKDFAIWFRDISEEPEKYDGKTIRYKGLIAKDAQMARDTFVAGRHIMTCCADDIAYNGLACVSSKLAGTVTSYDWRVVTGVIKIEKNSLYKRPGPVIHIESLEMADKPEPEVASF
jgi:hypothetical protein